MINKVAFDIYCADFHPDDVNSGLARSYWDGDIFPGERARAIRRANIAIRSMTTPSREMIESGYYALNNMDIYKNDACTVTVAYIAMLEKALEE